MALGRDPDRPRGRATRSFGFGSLIVGGATLIVGAVQAYRTPVPQITAGCLGCPAPPPVLTWSPSIVFLLAAGVTLALVGSVGLALTARSYRRGGPLGAALDGAWGGFWAGAPAWTLGMTFLLLLLMDSAPSVTPATSLLPNDSGAALLVGGVVLLVLAPLAWSRSLRGAPRPPSLVAESSA